ncbi:MAG: homoaconitate hydratase [Zestosphaera sp.]
MVRLMAWFTDKWFVSPYNYVENARKGLRLPERVYVHDTTLRDGEQQPGIAFRRDEKLEIAVALDEAGVDFIEAGMPAVSGEDFEALKAVVRQGLKAKVLAFSRCLKEDVDLALKIEVPGLVMELPSSEHMIKYAYRWSIDKALERSQEALEYAKQHGLYVKFFTIDSTRSSMEFFTRVIKDVSERMDSMVIADTFGVMSPYAMEYFVRSVKEFVSKPLEVHAHNDFGLAVANSIAAVAGGATVAHVTVNGIGERSGNAALEETVLALELLLGVKTNVKLDRLYELSKLVERLSGVPLPPQKAVVGDNAVRVESGILVDWWYNVKDVRPVEMLPYLPSLIGRKTDVIVLLGKKSGRRNVAEKLKEMGVPARDETVALILAKLKSRSVEKKRALTEEEFKELVREVLGSR